MSPRLIAARRRGRVRSDARHSRGLKAFTSRTGAKCIAWQPHDQGVAVGVDCTSGPPEAIGSDVLLAVGRVPNTHDLGLEKAGVATDGAATSPWTTAWRPTSRASGRWRLQRPRRVSRTTAYNDYEIVAANLLDGAVGRSANRVPAYALYIDPPLGRVGMTETQARATGPAAADRRRVR
jgi:pyruvate/2-oxoglutarate dehydrogenase complex dihydrolipoamide dehydrogenase (E3) component